MLHKLHIYNSKMVYVSDKITFFQYINLNTKAISYCIQATRNFSGVYLCKYILTKPMNEFTLINRNSQLQILNDKRSSMHLSVYKFYKNVQFLTRLKDIDLAKTSLVIIFQKMSDKQETLKT